MQPDNIIQKWNISLQELLRLTGETPRLNLGPPMVARFLAIVGTAAYEAWRTFDDKALTTLTKLTPIKANASMQTLKNKEEAISYAIFRVLEDLLPPVKAAPNQKAVDLFNSFVKPFFEIELGYSPIKSGTNPAEPSGIGNAVAAALINARKDDGANQKRVLGEHR